MAIAQDAFYIPDDIATGLATGLYRRIGSVVRYAVGPNKGQIVKHLQPIDLKAAEQAQGLGAKALQFVQHHKKEVGIAAIGAAVVGVGIWGYNKWKNHEPKVLTEFRAALKTYIDAIRNGNMDIDKINGLSYEEIAKRGGGILNSAKRLHDTSEDGLYEQALERVYEMIGFGTGAADIKSGYGLSTEEIGRASCRERV